MSKRLNENELLMGLIDEHDAEEQDFFAPRSCLLKPIKDIFDAAELLSQGADAHLMGDRDRADACFKRADMPTIGRWTDSIWGRHQQSILRHRQVLNAPPIFPVAERPRPRTPGAEIKRAVVNRDGYHCRFCGIPVIHSAVRDLLRRAYSASVRWESTAANQHTAFQCMWLQYDHVLPNGRGGTSSLENLVVTCAPCNFGRMERTLEEVGLIDPRLTSPVSSSWDGLERLRRSSRPIVR